MSVLYGKTGGGQFLLSLRSNSTLENFACPSTVPLDGSATVALLVGNPFGRAEISETLC